MILAVSDVRLTASSEAWPLDSALSARIAAHWERAVESNPRLWNGRVLGTIAPGRPGGIAIDDGVLSARTVEGDYAAFLAWRDWGFPEIGVRNLFGSAVILSGDGALIYGVMGAHTANAGRVYPPGGSLEPGDVVADGRVDVFGSIDRELQEETGLMAADAAVEANYVIFDGPRVSVARVLRFEETAERLARQVRLNLDRQTDRELTDVAVIRTGAVLDPLRVPGYARTLAAHVLGG